MRYRPAGDVHWRTGSTENISRSGVLFRASHPMPPLTAIEIVLALPREVGGSDDTVICRARVVRTEPATEDDPRPTVAASIAGYRVVHVQDDDPRRI